MPSGAFGIGKGAWRRDSRAQELKVCRDSKAQRFKSAEIQKRRAEFYGLREF
jgi:hypothetical protein